MYKAQAINNTIHLKSVLADPRHSDFKQLLAGRRYLICRDAEPTHGSLLLLGCWVTLYNSFWGFFCVLSVVCCWVLWFYYCWLCNKLPLRDNKDHLRPQNHKQIRLDKKTPLLSLKCMNTTSSETHSFPHVSIHKHIIPTFTISS